MMNGMSVSVVTQDEREHPLDYAEVIAPGASRLGTLAEWRIIDRDGKETPVALIVRVYTKDDDSRSPSQHHIWRSRSSRRPRSA